MAKLTEEDKKVKAEEKAEKARIRAEKKAQKEANKPPKHQAKLDRAKAQLPELNDAESHYVERLTSEFPLHQLEKIAAHVNFFVRQEQTKNAVASEELKVGQTVRIKSGNQKHLGKIGVVSRSQRIRCYVEVPGVDKEIYLFTSDVELVKDENVENLAQNDTSQDETVELDQTGS